MVSFVTKPKKKQEVVWQGSSPRLCQICQTPVGSTFVDGKTRIGPWAIMCCSCHDVYGTGLGQGKGQLYRYRSSDDKFVKVIG